MTKPTPRKRRRQKTKQAILKAAREIIAEKGVAELSLRAIAHQIDYSPAGLYEYFKSKDEIIDTVCIEGLERLSTYLNRVPTDLPPSERLLELGLAYLDFARNNPQYFLLIFTTTPSDKVPFSDSVKGDTPYDILLQAVQAVIEAENINLPPEYGLDEVAYILWAQVHGMAMLQQTVHRHFEHDFHTIDRWALEILKRGLTAE
jgi:AcrR family transcriptional regulator